MDLAADDGELHDGMFSETHSVVDARVGLLVGGNYRITRHIGSGGSSHVFEAEHIRLGNRFAVKLLRPEIDANRRTAQRFRREARAIARLKSEHIVSVIDCGELDDGTPYLVMELLEGEDLRSLLNREGSLPVRRAVPLIIEACRGLTQVHAASLVHRDLKPENLFITKRSTGEDWCKVLDFGVAKMEASLSTAEGAIVGTARYMAPEQLADSAAVSATTDIYALGAILYECVAGRPLVTGSTVQEVMYRVMNTEPGLLSELGALPSALVDVIERCIHKSPAARPSSVDQLATLLEGAVAVRAQGATTNVTFAEDNDGERPVLTRRLLVGMLASALGGAFAVWHLRGQVSPPVGEHPSFPSPVAAGTARTATATVARSDVAPANQPGGARLPSDDSKPTPTASTKNAASAPHPTTSTAHRARPVSGFDSENPYAE